MKTTRLWALGSALLVALGAWAQTETNRPATLKGTVVGAAGSPVAGATVGIYAINAGAGSGPEDVQLEGQVVTDAQGSFEFAGRPRGGFATLLARKPGLAPAWIDLRRLASQPQRLVLTPPATLAGTVVDETGKPVRGAEVTVALASRETPAETGGRVMAYLTGKLARECFSARSGADGQFRIEGFPTNASALLTVRLPGKALRSTAEQQAADTLPWQAGQEGIRLVIEPAGIIEGRVTVQGSSTEVPVARLTLRSEGIGFVIPPDASEDTLSKSNGTFRLTDVPAGTYRLHATFGTNMPPDWVAAGVAVTVESGQTAGNLEIPAMRGGLVEVAVVSAEDRKPLEGVSLNVYRERDQTAATSGADGRALLRLPPGDYQLFAQHPGGSMQQSSVTVEADRTNRVEIELAGPRKLTGVVRRPDGQPASGLPVRIVLGYSPEEEGAQTDLAGKFEVGWNPQGHGGMERTSSLLIRDPERGLAVAQDIGEDTGALDLRLEAAMTIVGRVECDGKPVTNVTVALVFWTGNNGMHLPGLATGTNAPGRFEIAALPVGRRYGLQVSAPGHGQRFIDAVPADEAKRVELDPIELKPANLKLSGQVVDADDKPVAGVHVNLHGEGQPNATARTDRGGRFTFTQVCEGSARLFANANNAHGNVSAEGGDTNVVLRLGESYGGSSEATRRTVKGMVTDPEGQPVRGAEVAVFPFGQQARRKTEASGAFNLMFSLEPWQMQSGGDPCLVVRDLVRNLAATEDLPEEATNLTVQLKPALTLTGRVEDTTGAPLANAQVGMWLLAGRTYSQLNEQPASTDTNGAFALKGVPAGRKYIVFASAKDHGRQQQPFEPEEDGGSVEVDTFVLKLADQVIAGQVVDEKERPIFGAHVSLSGEGQPEGSTMTDSKGRFRFKVCDGLIRIFASGQDGYANATAEPGDTNLVVRLGRSDGSFRQAPRRVSLKGKPLPDLSTLQVTAEALPAGKTRLVCLFDAEQRPSRRVVRQLVEQHKALAQKGIAVVAVQAAPMSDEAFEVWKKDTAAPFPVGRLAQKSPGTKWVAEVQSLPWLILTDAGGRVADEGFPFDELEAKIGDLKD